MTTTENIFHAVVDNSPVNGRQLTILDATGHALVWIELTKPTYTMGELTAIASNNGFHLVTPWVAAFQGNAFTLSASVRSA